MAIGTRAKTGKRETAPPVVSGGITGTPYDVESIRSDFPILYREVYGKPLVYLDNAASTQKPRSVIETMDHIYRFEYANVHRGLHYLSNMATQRFEDARESVRRFLNAGSVDEIIFTKNATAAINLVADSFLFALPSRLGAAASLGYAACSGDATLHHRVVGDPTAPSGPSPSPLFCDAKLRRINNLRPARGAARL